MSTTLKAGGWFTVLFALPAIAIVEIKWSKGVYPLSLPVLLFKAAAVALLVIVTLAISKGTGPTGSQLTLLAGSKFTFVTICCPIARARLSSSAALRVRVSEVQPGRFGVPAVLIPTTVGVMRVSLEPRPVLPPAERLLFHSFPAAARRGDAAKFEQSEHQTFARVLGQRPSMAALRFRAYRT